MIEVTKWLVNRIALHQGTWTTNINAQIAEDAITDTMKTMRGIQTGNTYLKNSKKCNMVKSVADAPKRIGIPLCLMNTPADIPAMSTKTLDEAAVCINKHHGGMLARVYN